MTFEHSLRIAAPPDDLFELTQDYARRCKWDPFLLRAMSLDGPKDEPIAPNTGVRVRCFGRLGMFMDVEYVSYRPPRVAAVKMLAGPWALRRFAGSWLFRPRSPGETVVTFRYHYRVKSVLLKKPVAWWFGWETRRRLRALKEYAESQRYLNSPLNIGLATQ